jgi:DNA-binding NarL/FixJ family response regulator
MTTGLVPPHPKAIEAGRQPVQMTGLGRPVPHDVPGEVLSGLREMLDLAASGELELKVVGEARLAVVNAHNGLMLTLVVEISEPTHLLSPRELQIARLVANGATNHAIAGELDISTWTVSTHLRRIFAKLNVCTRAEMVAQLFATPHLLSDT